MKNIILGDGITGLVIAACLNYNNEEFEIYGDGNYKPPSVLLLNCKNQYEIMEYFHIFEIPHTTEYLKKYVKTIHVGYTEDFKTITEEPTPLMKLNYLLKQNRKNTKSAMSDNLTSFVAIDLKLVYEHLKEKYKEHIITQKVNIHEFKNKNNCTIYNTIFPTELNNFEPSIEYIVIDQTDTEGYDYIYDCNKDSKIKRITKEYIEFSSKPEGEYDFEIKNYYNEPRIYTTSYTKTNMTWIDIGRNATRTQTKQEDIIKFMVKYE